MKHEMKTRRNDGKPHISINNIAFQWKEDPSAYERDLDPVTLMLDLHLDILKMYLCLCVSKMKFLGQNFQKL